MVFSLFNAAYLLRLQAYCREALFCEVCVRLLIIHDSNDRRGRTHLEFWGYVANNNLVQGLRQVCVEFVNFFSFIHHKMSSLASHGQVVRLQNETSKYARTCSKAHPHTNRKLHAIIPANPPMLLFFGHVLFLLCV